MEKSNIIKDISCNKTDCFGNVKGACSILKTTKFRKECPFYKPKEEK